MFTKSTIAKIIEIAKGLKVDPEDLLAVAEVESGGVATWLVNGQPVPPIRFEGHYFHRLVPESKLMDAVKAGLAHPKAGGVKNPTSYSARYALLARAAKIDKKAAFESTSWGIGQVMGDHWEKLGYGSVEAMVNKAQSIDGQIEIMCRYIQKFGLLDELQRNDDLGFATGYNGPAAKRYGYDKKIGKARARWEVILSDGLGKDDTVFVMNRPRVKDLQNDLAVLGYYHGAIDGITGDKTKAATRRFQSANGLVADGIIGPMTLEALDKAKARRHHEQGSKAIKAGTGVTGTGAAADVIATAMSSLEPVANYSDVIQYVVIALVVAGVALTLWGIYKGYKGRTVHVGNP